MIEDWSGPITGVAWDTPVGSGVIADHGAHVLAWHPVEIDPVVWMSGHAVFAEGTAIRGGVPICFPWFGPGRSGDQTPSHGFGRTTTWRRLEAVEVDDTVRIVHELDQQLASTDSFAHPYRVLSTVTAGAELRMELTVENTGGEPFNFEGALHTYLAVGDVREIEIDGLEGAPYRDQVNGIQSVQRGPIVVSGEVDRIYESTATVEVRDPVLGRVIEVAKTGSSSTIVWNPWIDKAQRLNDFGDDEWQQMVCVETANVGTHAVTLGPGETHRMTATLSVRRPSGS
jgi:glucose-6-phosphate 1-epimerase